MAERCASYVMLNRLIAKTRNGSANAIQGGWRRPTFLSKLRGNPLRDIYKVVK